MGPEKVKLIWNRPVTETYRKKYTETPLQLLHFPEQPKIKHFSFYQKNFLRLQLSRNIKPVLIQRFLCKSKLVGDGSF